ncbi:2-hydroxy-6-oxohepta-2,4-dienoate hydrolase [Helicobacter pylori X47-2AL]|uniref:2-hydroxy-6-oxohepta-2,4-dienoate hydrolase n=1 Tax=Helicobacter pylori X47-2AL TaxID=1386083 RepID=V6LJV1_HELPX|nr:lipase EstV [Helicobacter pylori]EST41019.1 2-hydroxy-6-oxohepta-2,4-dienoate hydrolase [Helicobacter pylori X47-2AL]MUT73911.1 lipase EstV [Helicobacter pylori]MUT81412.1 lipase EstV [Helicobacter pylori]WQS74021.1 lipase EstV [Helicobacter pylori]
MAKRSIAYLDSVFDISYTFIDHHSPLNALFLHGWGSSKEVMQQAFQGCFLNYNHLYVDLPGFNQSPNDEKVLETKDYANIINLFLKSVDKKAHVVFGHSFGGKVAILCENERIVLLSSAGILEPKPLKVRCKILLAKIFKKLGLNLGFLRSKDAMGLNQAMYETFKKVISEDFSDHFKRCEKEVLLFWGKDDKATPLSSAQKMQTLLKRSALFVLEGDHFFFLNQAKEVEKLVENYHHAKS